MPRKAEYSSPIFICCFRYRTVAPNGIRASFASLKHCLPKGIPMIVTHSTAPSTAASTAMGIPLKINQKILQTTETALPPNSTSLPNGKNASFANLKHCFPMGIPTIVMHQSTPAATQLRPVHSPPNRNQRIFPRQPIPAASLSQYAHAKMRQALVSFYGKSCDASMVKRAWGESLHGGNRRETNYSNLWPMPMDGSGNQNFRPIGFEEQQRLSPVRSFNRLIGKIFPLSSSILRFLLTKPLACAMILLYS